MEDKDYNKQAKEAASQAKESVMDAFQSAKDAAKDAFQNVKQQLAVDKEDACRNASSQASSLKAKAASTLRDLADKIDK